ncbi:lytic polysaccharide monooxygenase [Allokutzneria multivorans]|uniref:Lytic polysaccharide monooxygenase n=1 Tax=Allokutzneria multivorans TaxID=1142134 RepID=A0ABP7TW12_9PSEU
MASKLLGRISAVAAACVALPLVLTGVAGAHGYTTNVPSRSYLCKTGAVTGCGPIQWEPQSVEGPKGFPARGPGDGRICAGGLSQFAQLDDPRGGSWPARKVSSGQNLAFSWTLTAAHATTSFRYFITRAGWNPSAPLTRAALEPAPFYAVDFKGARPGSTVTHTGKLPTRSGRHLILAVWDIADTGNAFYQCGDVTF